MEVKLPVGLLGELEKKYDMTKLKHYSKEDLIDIVHKAKCGKLQGLDTSNLSKDEIVKHLIESKCPEVHSMIVELEEAKGDIESFVSQYLKDGKKITKENIYFSGIQELITPAFLVDAVEKKRYDCILRFNESYKSYSLNLFPYSHMDDETYSFRLSENIDVLLKKLTDDMERCIKNGSKLIAIPIIHHRHANIVLYRVKEKTFERYEPHGTSTRLNRLSISKEAEEISRLKQKIEEYAVSSLFAIDEGDSTKYKKKLEAIDSIKDLAKEYNKKMKNKKIPVADIVKVSEDLERSKKEFIKNYTQILINFIPKKQNISDRHLYINLKFIIDAKARIEELSKDLKVPQMERVDKRVNEALTDVLTVRLPAANPIFAGATYIAPNMLVVAEKGLQSIEPRQLRKSKELTDEEYENRVGGFCLLWSILYLHFVFKFPDMSYREINKALLQLLHRDGEDAFANLSLGFLEHLKKIIDKKIKGIDYTKFTKATANEKDKMLLSLDAEIRKQYDI